MLEAAILNQVNAVRRASPKIVDFNYYPVVASEASGTVGTLGYAMGQTYISPSQNVVTGDVVYLSVSGAATTAAFNKTTETLTLINTARQYSITKDSITNDIYGGSTSGLYKYTGSGTNWTLLVSGATTDFFARSTDNATFAKVDSNFYQLTNGAAVSIGASQPPNTSIVSSLKNATQFPEPYSFSDVVNVNLLPKDIYARTLYGVTSSTVKLPNEFYGEIKVGQERLVRVNDTYSIFSVLGKAKQADSTADGLALYLLNKTTGVMKRLGKVDYPVATTEKASASPLECIAAKYDAVKGDWTVYYIGKVVGTAQTAGMVAINFKYTPDF